MLGTQNLALFLASSILLNLTPGQDTLYIVGRSLAQGRRAGLLSVAGISSGCIVHAVAAALGISAILATSAAAFTIVKLAGAGYLIYLGVRMIFERGGSGAAPNDLPRDRPWAIYRAGFLTNVLNPKVALFFMAFLPQFVAPDAESKMLALLFLGGLFLCTGTTWCLVLVVAASWLSSRFRGRPGAGAWLRRVAGAVFVGLGVRLAVSR